MMNTYREFALAIRNDESGTVMDYVTERIDALWKAKLETALSDFEQAFLLEFQQSERIKDSNPELLFSTAYHVGRWDGFLDAMEKLYYREESLRIAQETMEHLEEDASQTQTAQKPIPRPSKRVLEILECLNQHGEMRHGELADAVHTTPQNLSNLMKKILQTGLARSRRTGRNTCYEVTDLGRHFCRQEKQREEQRAEFDAAVEKRAKELAEQYWLERSVLPAYAEKTPLSWTDGWLSQLFGKKANFIQRRNQDDLPEGTMYVQQDNSYFSNSQATQAA